MRSWLFAVLVGGLPIAVFVIISLFLQRRRRAEFKNPFTGKLLRPPGEALREKIVSMDDEIDNHVMGFFLPCLVAAGFAYSMANRLNQPGFYWVIGFCMLLFYGICAYYAFRIFSVGALRRDYYLGFLGERAVGEELNQMLAHGYQVFHDIQFEGRPGSKGFNIDHVAVGPGGVFSVETKTRRKRVRRGYNSPRNTVEFDGSKLIYPWGSEVFGIRQARDNAAYLSKWLQEATCEEINAIPILALPGWSVSRIGRSNVLVVSGREICSAFPKDGSRNVLSPEQIKRIAYQLEQRCRNVEVE